MATKASLVTNTSAIAPTLAELFANHPRLGLAYGEDSIYRQFRCIEPTLVSCLDGDSGAEKRGLEVFVLREGGKPRGVLSFTVGVNKYRHTSPNKFARIDLVIVDKDCRKLGYARLLIFATLLHLLKTYGGNLYSISCLAAHKAIEKTLEKLDFSGDRREEMGFKHEELKLESLKHEDLAGKFYDMTADWLHVVNFRLRQEENSSSR